MGPLTDLDWSRTPQLSVGRLLAATFVPSGLGMVGFHVVLPRVVAAGVPALPAWLCVAIVWLAGLVAFALWLLRGEARVLQVPLRTRLCLKRLTASEWGINVGLMLVGLLAVLPAQRLVPAFMEALGLAVPAYMPFFLNPGIDPSSADPAALSPGLPLRGSYGLLPLVAAALLLVVLAEELYFRAWMLPKLARYGRWSWVVNGVMFALYHTFQIWLLPPILAGSLLMAFVCYRSKSIWPPLVAHLVGNFLLGVAAMLVLVAGK